MQENCYNHTVLVVRGSVLWIVAGCHGPCEQADQVCDSLDCKTCDVATKLCYGGWFVSFCLIFSYASFSLIHRSGSTLGQGGTCPPPDSLVAPHIQKLADRSGVISEVPKCS